MLVPRLLWPSKPITTTSGSAVNFLLGVQSTNQIAVTMFADIYWNLGFPGLLLMMAETMAAAGKYGAMVFQVLACSRSPTACLMARATRRIA